VLLISIPIESLVNVFRHDVVQPMTEGYNTMTQMEKAKAFRALHERDGAFIIPNPWGKLF